MKIKYWKLFLALQLVVVISCTSGVKEYREIKTEIKSLQDKAVNQEISSEEAAKKIVPLQKELSSFSVEVMAQYREEENLKREIKKKQRNDSIQKIKQAQIRLKEVSRKKRIEYKRKQDSLREEAESLAQAKIEGEADLRIMRLIELKKKGLFLIEFDRNEYEININEWNTWKNSNQQQYTKAIEETKVLRSALGRNKLQNITTSMYRTLSNRIRQDKVSMKTLEGIQVYDILRTGEVKFE